MAVHAPLNVVCSVAYDNADTLAARPGILRETSSELLCSAGVEEVDGSKTVTGTMLELHGDKRDQSSLNTVAPKCTSCER